MKKSVKILIILALIAALSVGAFFGVKALINKRSLDVEVKVYPVSDISSEYYSEDSFLTSGGTVYSNYMQEIQPEKEKRVKEIYVKEGDSVSQGDNLLKYDDVKLQLNYDSIKLEIEQLNYELQADRTELSKWQAETPKQPAAPKVKQTVKNPGEGLSDNACTEITSQSVPYKGSGTSEDPYTYLVSKDVVITDEFLNWVKSSGENETIRIVSEGDKPGEGAKGSINGESGVGENAIYAVLEIRRYNNEAGALLGGWTINGNDKNLETFDTGEPEEEYIEEPEEEPPAEEGFSAEEIASNIKRCTESINQKEQELKEKQLGLDAAQAELDKVTVKASVSGVVKSVLSYEDAVKKSRPIIQILGGDGIYIKGQIKESDKDNISPGMVLHANSYEYNRQYNVEIIDISIFPEELNGNYYSDEEDSDSYYSFTGIIKESEGLSSGDFLEIMLPHSEDGSESFDVLYIEKPYIKRENGSFFALKDDNGKLKRTVVQVTIITEDYIGVESGVDRDDYLAFPYGKNAREGAKTVKEERNYYD